MKDMKRTKAGSPIQKLAELNGYQVALDTPTKNQNERVQLAEGIVARPEYYYTRRRQCEYTLYSLELDSENTSDRLPPLVEPDITIYRLLEGRVEDWLNTRRDAWQSRMEMFWHRVMGPFRTRSEDMSALCVSPQQTNDDREENLLVVTDTSLVMITHMRPSLRLLALPHELRHKSASTLISVSVVILSAVPVAYRSINFALAYPGLTQAIAASVMATVVYGLWSTRSMARTRQAGVLAHALSRRILAQNDAVVLVLQDGAIQRLTSDIMDVYRRPSSEWHQALAQSEGESFVLDPVKIALDLGLIKKAKVNAKFQWTKPELDDAVASINRLDDSS